MQLYREEAWVGPHCPAQLLHPLLPVRAGRGWLALHRAWGCFPHCSLNALAQLNPSGHEELLWQWSVQHRCHPVPAHWWSHEWQRCCWVSLPSICTCLPREEAQIPSGHLYQFTLTGTFRKCWLTPQWFSPTGIGQLFTVRICHTAEPAISLGFGLGFHFLHLPDVPQPLIRKLYIEYQRHSGHWRGNVSFCLHHSSVRNGQEQLPALGSCTVARPPSSRIPSSSWISIAGSFPALLEDPPLAQVPSALTGTQ